MSRRRRVGYASIAVAVLWASGACGMAGDASAPRPEPTTTGVPTTVTPAVYGALQTLDQVSDGTRILVARTEMHGVSGFVVIHDESQGGPHDVLGHVFIPEGVSTSVVVTLERAAISGPYWAMLHRDAGKVGVFEWPGPDGPVRAATGIRYAQKRLTLTVEPQQ